MYAALRFTLPAALPSLSK